MKTHILACSTLQEELNDAMKQTNLDIPVIWLKSGLHNVPRKLNAALQDAMNQAEEEGAEQILFAFGFCGNAMAGLASSTARLIIPRADDCITLLLGSFKRRQAIQNEQGTYFMTKGWLDGERNIWTEYRYVMERYGQETGREIFDTMFGNYKRIGILDTHCYDMEPVKEETLRICDCLHLGMTVLEASNDRLQKLLTGPYSADQFLVVPPQIIIQESDLSVE